MTSSATIVLRRFNPDDHAAARALWRRTPGLGLSAADEPAAIAAYLARNPGTSFVAMSGGQIVGTILCGHDGRRGLIHHLVTDASLRRQGIARALLERALAALKAQGIDKCHAMAFRDNADGAAFWRAVGATQRVDLDLWSMPTD